MSGDRSADGDEGSTRGDPGEGPTADSQTRPPGSGQRLLLDAMLGRLATYLRMCGHDAAYALDRGIEDDDALRDLVATENRTLVTRNRELGARTDGAIVLTSTDIDGQLAAVAAAGVDLSATPSTSRCGRCNGELRSASDRPAHAPEDVPIYRCRDCEQAFWPGSHWAAVTARLAPAQEDG